MAGDLNTAKRLANDYNMNVITKDGDRIYKRGGMKGGYYNIMNNRLYLYQKIQNQLEEVSILWMCHLLDENMSATSR